MAALQSAPYDPLSLRWAALRSADSALRTIRQGALSDISCPSWEESRSYLTDHLSAIGPGHCFGVEPHNWAELQEPQITKGLVYFLTSGSLLENTARSLALLRAVHRADCGETKLSELGLSDVNRVRVFAEGKAGERQRIDIVVIVQTTTSARYGAVIEAKIGHHVTDRQLATYLLAAGKIPYSLTLEHTSFVVVAPSLTSVTVRQLRRNPAWQFMPWRVFIRSLSTEVAELNCDNDDFRRFRRTVWKCAA